MVRVEHPRVGLDRVISFGGHSYPYYVRSGPDTWPELLQRLAALQADRFVLVTDAAFPYALACDALARITELCPCTLHTFAAGERAKNLMTVEALAQEALAVGVTRRSCIIGLGGGLAGNVAGLLAALLFRGIRLVHIPTTLLAMSDSVLSLKQAVNTRLGKNHLGTYYAPQWVWNDLSYLRSLPRIEIQAALCELIKNVLAICPEHYARVASLLNPAAVYTEEQYVQFIELCVTAKCAVMRDDPQEKRDALVLEYGHTVGHALELLAQEVLPAGTLPHGLAIGLGMLVAARISCMMGLLSADDEQAHMELLRRNGVPTAIPQEIPTVALITAINHDNKRGYLPQTIGNSLMVLLERLGRPHRSQGTVLTQVSIEMLYAGIEALRP